MNDTYSNFYVLRLDIGCFHWHRVTFLHLDWTSIASTDTAVTFMRSDWILIAFADLAVMWIRIFGIILLPQPNRNNSTKTFLNLSSTLHGKHLRQLLHNVEDVTAAVVELSLSSSKTCLMISTSQDFCTVVSCICIWWVSNIDIEYWIKAKLLKPAVLPRRMVVGPDDLTGQDVPTQFNVKR